MLRNLLRRGQRPVQQVGHQIGKVYPTALVFRYPSIAPYTSSSFRANDSFEETLRKMNEKLNKKNTDDGSANTSATEAQAADNNAKVTDKETTGGTPEQSKEDSGDGEKSDSSETKEAPQSEDTSSASPKFEMPEVDPQELASKAGSFARDAYYSFRDNLQLAWEEMTGQNKQTTLSKKVQQAETYKKPTKKSDDDDEEEEEEVYDGPSAIVLVKEPESAWERMKQRLQDSPIIREMLKGGAKIGKSAADTDLGKKAQEGVQNVKDKMEDAREFWETSQNPLVYTISGVWENLTGETEEGMCITEIRKLDPGFMKEDWADEVKSNLVPKVIKAHLEGDTRALKPWCGEAVFNKLAADIRERKKEGHQFDTNILDIDENALVMKVLDGQGAVIVAVYMVQQINCIRNKEGEIVEGGESNIVAKFYHLAFTQVYDEDDGFMQWKIQDYQFGGDTPYI